MHKLMNRVLIMWVNEKLKSGSSMRMSSSKIMADKMHKVTMPMPSPEMNCWLK